MRRSLLFLPLVAMFALAASPATAQTSSLYTRHKSPRFDREAPIPELPEPAALTAEQKVAIAPVRWPAVWPAPKVPAGTVLTVPPRPDWQPQPGEYWGPFTDGTGAWGFMLGPRPATPAPPTTSFATTPLGHTRFGAAPPPPAPLAPPAPPAAPALPVAGPVSPQGRMVVTYPDGNQVTWQFPMVDYKARLTGISPDGTIQLTDAYGRRGLFTFARNARVTVNGRDADRSRLPIGAAVSARALRLAPTELTIFDLSK